MSGNFFSLKRTTKLSVSFDVPGCLFDLTSLLLRAAFNVLQVDDFRLVFFSEKKYRNILAQTTNILSHTYAGNLIRHNIIIN